MRCGERNGNHVFRGACRWSETEAEYAFIFEKNNFTRHEFRHRISDPEALREIDMTIFDPDLVTAGPKPVGRRNLYRVKWHKDGRRGERALMLWRVHCFPRGGRFYIIATAFEGATSVGNAVHYLEKTVWKKPNSKI